MRSWSGWLRGDGRLICCQCRPGRLHKAAASAAAVRTCSRPSWSAFAAPFTFTTNASTTTLLLQPGAGQRGGDKRGGRDGAGPQAARGKTGRGEGGGASSDARTAWRTRICQPPVGWSPKRQAAAPEVRRTCGLVPLRQLLQAAPPQRLVVQPPAGAAQGEDGVPAKGGVHDVGGGGELAQLGHALRGAGAAGGGTCARSGQGRQQAGCPTGEPAHVGLGQPLDCFEIVL